MYAEVPVPPQPAAGHSYSARPLWGTALQECAHQLQSAIGRSGRSVQVRYFQPFLSENAENPPSLPPPTNRACVAGKASRKIFPSDEDSSTPYRQTLFPHIACFVKKNTPLPLPC